MAVAPPKPKDMPLNALRAFEAAARLGGFAAAADELGVTPAAVTAHVKGLEAELGAPLFARGAKGVELTALGKRTAPAFALAFDALSQAVRDLREEALPQVVHVAALPAIAQLWLSPRLPALRAEAPDIAVSITAMEAPPNLKRSPYDLCLFYGDGAHGRIADDALFPVCAPSFLPRLQGVEDLAAVPCLSDATWRDDWAHWLAVAAPDGRVVPRGPVFSLYALAVEEAVNGAGVLMGRRALIAAHVARGALVQPFGPQVPIAEGLHLWAARPLRRSHPIWRVARLLGQG